MRDAASAALAPAGADDAGEFLGDRRERGAKRVSGLVRLAGTALIGRPQTMGGFSELQEQRASPSKL